MKKQTDEQTQLGDAVKNIRSSLPTDLIGLLNKGKRYHEKEKNVRGKS